MTAYTADTPREWRQKGGTLSKKLATEFGLIDDMLAPFDVEASIITVSRALKLSAMGGASAAKAQLLGIGTSVSPATTSVVDGKFIEMRCETTAASGDNRLAYMRYFIAGAGGGECVRGSTVINENTGTAHGAHFGIEFKAEAGASECSGLGVGLRGTLMIPDIASWAPTGTYAGGMFEIYSEGTASDPAGMTELSVLRLVNAGDSTGMADVDTDAFLFSIQGFTAAADATKVLSSVSLAELPGSTVGLRCKVGSSTYYVPMVLASEWN
jgi:hypothetical protein